LLRQHQEIRLSAERWNLEVVRTVEVTDVSGTQVLKSQEFQQLLRSLPNVDGVVVAAIDRLIRPDDFSSFSIYDHFLKQKADLDSLFDAGCARGPPGFMEALVSGMMAGLDRRRTLRGDGDRQRPVSPGFACAGAKFEELARGRMASIKMSEGRSSVRKLEGPNRMKTAHPITHPEGYFWCLI
jgi:folate-dependent tRNA-U54 methylase TrmFO/GidA